MPNSGDALSLPNPGPRRHPARVPQEGEAQRRAGGGREEDDRPGQAEHLAGDKEDRDLTRGLHAQRQRHEDSAQLYQKHG